MRRILTTYAGSLPRPDGLADMIWVRTEGRQVEEAALEAQIEPAVAAVVAHRSSTGNLQLAATAAAERRPLAPRSSCHEVTFR